MILQSLLVEWHCSVRQIIPCFTCIAKQQRGKCELKKVISNALALGCGCVHNTMNWNVSALKIMHALLSSANNMASSELRVLTLDPRISLNKFGHLKCNKAAEQ